MKGADKIGVLQKIAVEESRLGIPLLFGMDVIHGYETVSPIPLALSSSWDMAAIEEAARVSAEEASAAGICWTFSPMADIARCVAAETLVLLKNEGKVLPLEKKGKIALKFRLAE